VVEVAARRRVPIADDEVDDRPLVHPHRREEDLAATPLLQPERLEAEHVAVPGDRALDVGDDEHDVVQRTDLDTRHARTLGSDG
jgi:hypothetical protein